MRSRNIYQHFHEYNTAAHNVRRIENFAILSSRSLTSFSTRRSCFQFLFLFYLQWSICGPRHKFHVSLSLFLSLVRFLCFSYVGSAIEFFSSTFLFFHMHDIVRGAVVLCCPKKKYFPFKYGQSKMHTKLRPRRRSTSSKRRVSQSISISADGICGRLLVDRSEIIQIYFRFPWLKGVNLFQKVETSLHNWHEIWLWQVCLRIIKQKTLRIIRHFLLHCAEII